MVGFTEWVARLKAWQAFFLLIVPFVAAQFYVVHSMVPNPDPPRPIGVEEVAPLFRIVWVMGVLWLTATFAWMLSIGFAINRRLKQGLRVKTRLVMFSAALVVLSNALGALIFPYPHEVLDDSSNWSLIFYAYTVATVAMVYVIGFPARCLKVAETQYPVTFFDYLGTLALVWTYPIGVWFVQPRVNRIVSNEAPLDETQQP